MPRGCASSYTTCACRSATSTSGSGAGSRLFADSASLRQWRCRPAGRRRAHRAARGALAGDDQRGALAVRTSCVQRNSAKVFPVVSLLTVASQMWVWRPRCAGVRGRAPRPGGRSSAPMRGRSNDSSVVPPAVLRRAARSRQHGKRVTNRIWIRAADRGRGSAPEVAICRRMRRRPSMSSTGPGPSSRWGVGRMRGATSRRRCAVPRWRPPRYCSESGNPTASSARPGGAGSTPPRAGRCASSALGRSSRACGPTWISSPSPPCRSARSGRPSATPSSSGRR